MIEKTEIKPTGKDSYRVIVYFDSGESTGLLFDKASLYDVFCKLREIFKEVPDGSQ